MSSEHIDGGESSRTARRTPRKRGQEHDRRGHRAHLEDRCRGRLRGREDDPGRLGQRDPPAHSEETLSGNGRGRYGTDGMERKGTTTIAMDFGRITVHSGLTLHLFGTPGQDRFRFLWDELCEGALAAIVLADTRRPGDCFAAVDYFERGRIPFLVAVNRFPGAADHTEHDLARALDLDRGTPVVPCAARDRASGKEVLIRTVEYAGRMHTARLLASVG